MTTQAIAQETRSLLEAYLTHYPEEAELFDLLRRQLDDEDNCFVRSNMTGHVTASALVLSPDLEHVLLIHHKMLNRWMPPGGHFELPGGLWDTAVREVEEETGITGLRLHDWSIEHGIPLDAFTVSVPTRPNKNEGPHFHHDFRFLAVASEMTPPRAQEEEVLGARWAPLDVLAQSSAENRRLHILARKLRHALA